MRKNKLIIKKEKIDLHKPLFFTEGAFLLYNKMSNKFYLSKNNALVFEIEEQNTAWINFLNAIDNHLSVRQIMDELKIEYSAIKEFLDISVEEKILTT